jgi:hypothetical protein
LKTPVVVYLWRQVPYNERNEEAETVQYEEEQRRQHEQTKFQKLFIAIIWSQQENGERDSEGAMIVSDHNAVHNNRIWHIAINKYNQLLSFNVARICVCTRCAIC